MDYVALIWNRYLVNLLDIVLVAILFYQLLLLMQGTRAVQIAVGTVVLAAITLLAQFLGFRSLHWLLEKFWIAGAVVIAILFQPELRAGLARLGARSHRTLGGSEEMNVINEIVAAVKEASRQQLGMLIVLERTVGLRNYIESGTLVNGDVTREILLTLFQPLSPLHDGAVIIQGRRLVAAGCILPLSQEASLSKLLGTRHRAAVGITEVSDAWAICASEETGNISIAVDGKLSDPVAPDELRDRLYQLFQSPQRPLQAAALSR